MYKRNHRYTPRDGRSSYRGRKKIRVYDPTRFISEMNSSNSGFLGETEKYQTRHKFAEFDIDQKIKQNISAKGFSTPTPIQDQAIPLILKGEDVVGLANTGTGKTAAFLVPLIDKIIKDRRARVLVITPTRELAAQVEQEFRELANGTRARSVICIGGVGIGGQIQRLRGNPNLVVGTPGRLKDLEKRRALDFKWFGTIVLDEVDRMLDMGFVKDVTYIVSKLSRPRQSLFFSATMSDAVGNVMRRFTANPITVSVETQRAAISVKQETIRLNGRERLEVLDGLLRNREYEKVLVFGRTKRGIDKIEKALTKRNVLVASIHGNKSQGQRQRALAMFKTSKVQVLLATDIASRGLDISGVTHVINYDLPGTQEDYIHRIGRTGRAGQTGKALTFVG